MELVGCCRETSSNDNSSEREKSERKTPRQRSLTQPSPASNCNHHHDIGLPKSDFYQDLFSLLARAFIFKLKVDNKLFAFRKQKI
jgi:hypothetical protein